MVLGLTGKCCSGKDEVAAVLSRHGWEIIDVDALGHRAVSEKREELLETYGKGIVAEDGSIDRRRLGAVVFADKEKLRRLEAIVHPEMKRMLYRLVEGKEKVCINAALLFRMGLDDLCDAVILIKAPLPLRFFRAKRRDCASLLFLLRRFARQRSLFPKHMTDDVDMYNIWNCGSRKRLEVAIKRVLERLEKENEKQ